MLVAVVGFFSAHALYPRAVLADHQTDSPYVGSFRCNAVACHGESKVQVDSRGTAHNEFVLWLQHDPHALAKATIWSPKFADILRRLGAGHDPTWHIAAYARCARCHDPLGDVHPQNIRGELALVSHEPLAPQGIGCETCHGPARGWLARHYQRGVTRQELSALGMRDTKDLLVRGHVCAECHVGSPENDMNHDMIAAGHPALRWEFVSYHDRLSKHWNDPAERLVIDDFAAKLWVAGQLTAARAAVELSQARAQRAASKLSTLDTPLSTPPWPEFSEYDCLACHQRLRPGGANRPPSRISAVGIPTWGQWPLALVGPLVDRLDRPSGGKSPPSAAIDSLRRQMTERPQVGSQELSQAFQNCIRELWRGERNFRWVSEDQISVRPNSHAAEGRNQTGGRGSGRAASAGGFSIGSRLGGSLALPSLALQSIERPVGPNDVSISWLQLSLIRQVAREPPSWESSCQLFLALRAAVRGYRDEVQRLACFHWISHEQEEALLADSRADDAALAAIQHSLAFVDNRDWPRAFEITPDHRHGSMTLDRVVALIEELAQRLEQRWRQLGTIVSP